MPQPSETVFDRALAEARQLVEEARVSGSTSLSLASLAILELPSNLALLTDLTDLDLSNCRDLTSIQPLALLTSLQSLNLSACAQLQDLQPLVALTNLQSLNLIACAQLQDLRPLAALTSLQSLNLSGCDQLQDLQPLAALTSLQSLNLSSCFRLQDLRLLAPLTILQSLNLSGCDQLQDLRPLAALTILQSLNLSGCAQLQDLPSLAALTSLQSLDLRGCDQLQDLQSLAALTSLQSLNLSACDQLDLQPLAALTGLQSLNLSGCVQLQDLEPLATLTSLQSLNLSYCDQLQDLQPLAALTGLQSLNLSGCVQLQDLQPLATLTSLQSLNLSHCAQLQDLQLLAASTSLQSLDLSHCAQLQDLQLLAASTSLQSLDLSHCAQLQDLQLLAAFTSLQSLDLSGRAELRNLRPLATLTSLKSLNLSYCAQLQDLQPLATLRSLRNTWLNGIKIDCALGALPLAAWIRALETYADQLTGAPNELASKDDYFDNALPRIRAWQKDLLAGEASNSIIKTFFLGNGRVGKTQICRRLQGKRFDPSIPTTHGIDLGKQQLVPASSGQPEISARLWDFGGQSIYHGTHGLFIDDRAIYVIAWTPLYENTDEIEQDGITLRNRPLRYWIEYVRSLAGPLAPVIVVQTQCDRESDRREPSLPAEHGFERLLTSHCSAKAPNGIRRLRVELESAALYQLERYGKVRLPKSWCSVEQELEALRHRKTKTISHSEFEALSLQKHKTAVSEVVLQYLHRSGQVFYRQGAFGDQVVIDLDWAFDGIYAVHDRKKALPVLKAQAGRFTLQLLAALVWPQYSPADHELFISLMQQCQICFKTSTDSYIAPEALPPEKQVFGQIQQLWRNAHTPDAAAYLDYPFLHEGVLRAILCKVGERAGESAVYWSWGVCFYDLETQSTARIRTELADPTGTDPKGRIIVEAIGGQSQALVSHLVDSILKINIGAKPERHWIRGGATSSSQSAPEQQKPDQAFARIAPGQPPRAPGEPLPVYVSYAWGGESDALVDAFTRRLPKQFQLVRDKTAMRPGDWISTFMRDIGRAERVLVLLSEKYLKSVYCMRELLYLFQASLGERTDFFQRVVVLTLGDDLKFSRASDRAAHARYWQEEDTKLDAILEKLDRISIGDADRAEQLAIKDFAHRVSDILFWVSDTLIPRATVLNQAALDNAVDLFQQRAAEKTVGSS